MSRKPNPIEESPISASQETEAAVQEALIKNGYLHPEYHTAQEFYQFLIDQLNLIFVTRDLFYDQVLQSLNNEDLLKVIYDKDNSK